MRWDSVLKMSVVAGVAAAAFAIVSSPAVTGQARTSNIPRVNGKPDMNGLWQTINTANSVSVTTADGKNFFTGSQATSPQSGADGTPKAY